jgi:hypothetical protein
MILLKVVIALYFVDNNFHLNECLLFLHDIFMSLLDPIPLLLSSLLLCGGVLFTLHIKTDFTYYSFDAAIYQNMIIKISVKLFLLSFRHYLMSL